MEKFFRPEFDVSGRTSVRFWWSDKPGIKTRDTVHPRHKFGFDHLSRRKLDADATAFVERNWANVDYAEADMPDLLVGSRESVMIVSEKVKLAIEMFDLGVHEFIKIPNFCSVADSSPLLEKTFFVLNVTHTKRTIDIERSAVTSDTRITDGKKFLFLTAQTAVGCFVKSSASVPPHLWRDDQTYDAFVSDALKSTLDQSGCVGIHFFESTMSS